MHTDAELIPAAVLKTIAARAESIDQSGQWPQQDLNDLRRINVTRWAVPADHGGLGRSALEQHLGYEQLARASLAIALILSQRDAAIGLIEGSQSDMRSE